MLTRHHSATLSPSCSTAAASLAPSWRPHGPCSHLRTTLFAKITASAAVHKQRHTSCWLQYGCWLKGSPTNTEAHVYTLILALPCSCQLSKHASTQQNQLKKGKISHHQQTPCRQERGPGSRRAQCRQHVKVRTARPWVCCVPALWWCTATDRLHMCPTLPSLRCAEHCQQVTAPCCPCIALNAVNTRQDPAC